MMMMKSAMKNNSQKTLNSERSSNPKCTMEFFLNRGLVCNTLFLFKIIFPFRVDTYSIPLVVSLYEQQRVLLKSFNRARSHDSHTHAARGGVQVTSSKRTEILSEIFICA